MVADDTAGGRAKKRVMRQVAGGTADDRAFDAALGVGRRRDGERQWNAATPSNVFRSVFMSV